MSGEVGGPPSQQPVHLRSPIQVAEAPSPGKPISGGIAAQTSPPPPAAPEPFNINREIVEALNRSTTEALTLYETDIGTKRAIEQSNLTPDAKLQKLAQLRPTLERHATAARNLADANVEWQQRFLRQARDARREADEAGNRAVQKLALARHTVAMGTTEADAYFRSVYAELDRTGMRRQLTQGAYQEAQRHADEAQTLQLRVYHLLGVKPPPLPHD
ncbi:hypothetical protein [Bradyrhizobium sp. TM239]|uniref:hypothetical protein n=1 Tax=Bradyrhizobium sp. TM239 TaxID=2599802 RepID=UPI0027D6A171|nr:hypothetical protein TM239_65120 [Bradyrhizobium sp. TM239]